MVTRAVVALSFSSSSVFFSFTFSTFLATFNAFHHSIVLKASPSEVVHDISSEVG
jgi:hypothetical protein